MGSGTTARAARQLGHDFLGFELNPDFTALANEAAAAAGHQQVVGNLTRRIRGELNRFQSARMRSENGS